MDALLGGAVSESHVPVVPPRSPSGPSALRRARHRPPPHRHRARQTRADRAVARERRAPLPPPPTPPPPARRPGGGSSPSRHTPPLVRTGARSTSAPSPPTL